MREAMQPRLFLFGGPNGAGKTTVATRVLRSVGCSEFVNADSIASGLSPLNQDAVALEAGRIMLDRMHALATARRDFAFESTLASRSFTAIIRDCKRKGYRFHLVYIWLRSVDLARRRVQARVAAGGHSIPPLTIERRYQRGLWNLFSLYLPLADSFLAFDNSTPGIRPIAERTDPGQQLRVFDGQTWRRIVTLGAGVEH